MEWDISSIRHALGDKLIGNAFVREQICKTILLLPSDLIERVCKTVWFVSSPEDAWAITFKGSELKDRHIIFLSDELFREPEQQRRYTILHEIGHVVLNHSNSIGITQTESEINMQEQEADLFVKKYLSSV